MEEDSIKIQIYMKDDRVWEYEVTDIAKAREHASRIVSQGYINWEPDGLVYYPVHQIFKVKILGVPKGKYVANLINL